MSGSSRWDEDRGEHGHVHCSCSSHRGFADRTSTAQHCYELRYAGRESSTETNSQGTEDLTLVKVLYLIRAETL